MSQRFQRRIENFRCEHCGSDVVGNGYTNHCPKCLWSKHMDINPGDRASGCGGMMEPVAVEGSTGEGYKIRHQCTKCGHVSRISVAKDDSPDALIALAQNHKKV